MASGAQQQDGGSRETFPVRGNMWKLVGGLAPGGPSELDSKSTEPCNANARARSDMAQSWPNRFQAMDRMRPRPFGETAGTT